MFKKIEQCFLALLLIISLIIIHFPKKMRNNPSIELFLNDNDIANLFVYIALENGYFDAQDIEINIKKESTNSNERIDQKNSCDIRLTKMSSFLLQQIHSNEISAKNEMFALNSSVFDYKDFYVFYTNNYNIKNNSYTVQRFTNAIYMAQRYLYFNETRQILNRIQKYYTNMKLDDLFNQIESLKKCPYFTCNPLITPNHYQIVLTNHLSDYREHCPHYDNIVNFRFSSYAITTIQNP